MKKISRKLLKANMDRLFLSYCYAVAQLSTDYEREKIDALSMPDMTQEERDSIVQSLDADFHARVSKQNKNFQKGISLWAFLYANSEVIPDGLN